MTLDYFDALSVRGAVVQIRGVYFPHCSGCWTEIPVIGKAMVYAASGSPADRKQAPADASQLELVGSFKVTKKGELYLTQSFQWSILVRMILIRCFGKTD